MNHAEAIELAGLYVLDALEPAERAKVADHLASCTQAHDEFKEVGGVVPALATLADPVGAPAALKNKVLADYRARTGTGAVWQPAPVATTRPARPSWLGWAAAAAAVLLAVTAGWAYTAQSRADAEAHRAQVLAQAIDLMAAPGSSVALLAGSGSAAGANGFAAVGSNGTGYMVVVDLPPAPAGKTYQAWYIIDGRPVSAGLLSADANGFGVTSISATNNAQVIALTIEPAGGSEQPTTDPVLSGGLGVSA